jgi:hypothetical protein
MPQITRIKDFEDVGKLAKSDQYFSQARIPPHLMLSSEFIASLDKYDPASLPASGVHALSTET